MVIISKPKIVYCTLGFSILFFAILILFSDYFLSKNCPINAKILVIEGWLPVNELENINKLTNLNQYQEVIISGLINNENKTSQSKYVSNKSKFIGLPITLSHNATITIDNDHIKKISTPDSIIDLTVYASGTEFLSINAYFSLFLNSKFIGASFVSEDSKAYRYKINIQGLQNINIIIYFVNAIQNNGIDRNLTVDSVAVNSEVIKSGFYRAYKKELGENYYYYPFRSRAHFVARYLESLGNKQNFTIIDTVYSGRNKTYICAKKLRSYLNQKYISTPTINLISADGHSRRSYIAYKTSLGKKSPIGIISYTNKYKAQTKLETLIYNVREHCKLIVSYAIFLFSK